MTTGRINQVATFNRTIGPRQQARGRRRRNRPGCHGDTPGVNYKRSAFQEMHCTDRTAPRDANRKAAFPRGPTEGFLQATPTNRGRPRQERRHADPGGPPAGVPVAPASHCRFDPLHRERRGGQGPSWQKALSYA